MKLYKKPQKMELKTVAPIKEFFPEYDQICSIGFTYCKAPLRRTEKRRENQR